MNCAINVIIDGAKGIVEGNLDLLTKAVNEVLRGTGGVASMLGQLPYAYLLGYVCKRVKRRGDSSCLQLMGGYRLRPQRPRGWLAMRAKTLAASDLVVGPLWR
jgi:hypothetical protein